jgi:SAM-dependent methyltransferase
MPSNPNSVSRKIFPTAHRILLEKKIVERLPLMTGKILLVGAGSNPYGYLVSAKASVLVTDISNDYGVIDQIVDAHYLPFKNESFDFVLAIEVVEHLIDPGLAINEFHRVLRGGVIMSMPFMFHIHGDPYDYQRFTFSGIKNICKQFSLIDVVPIGCRVAVISDLITTSTPFFIKGFRFFNNILRLNFFGKHHSSDSPSGYWVEAVK